MSQAFDNIVSVLSNIDATMDKEITREQYEAWQKQWLLDAIAGKRYGQSFCEYFGISRATPLYFFRNGETSEKWIKHYYNG